jgi:hypothetical protein
MSTPDKPNVVLVPVKRYDINLTLNDILTPLTRMGANLVPGRGVAAPGTDLSQHVQQLSDLAQKLRDVVGHIDAADPSLLAPTTQAQKKKTP